MADSTHLRTQQRQVDGLAHRQYAGKKTLVLCFDGTGNKFSGSDGDSNIIKIFSMLDRADINQHVYYQPGIGTYVQSKTFSHTSTFSKIKSWYVKAKDSAIGTSFEAHVMSAYTFLMRYYQAGDDLYFFGFSRGAYTARFLASMLDSVGLLAAGNEELQRFAWKTFAQWQTRQEGTAEEKLKKDKTYLFMKRFKETFSIPVRRIRFMGLFDTVNSVPRFEAAWMQRSRFPYTARSSAKVIRHAVSIDERRAKFRQDLIGQRKPQDLQAEKRHHGLHLPHHLLEGTNDDTQHASTVPHGAGSPATDREARSVEHKSHADRPHLEHEKTNRSHHERLGLPVNGVHPPAAKSTSSLQSVNSQTVAEERTKASDDGIAATAEQDIQEVWFPGCHADIGGGWPLMEGEDVAISHAPLMWMIREARKAGLPFDEQALRSANYILDDLAPANEPVLSEKDGFEDAKESQTPGHGPEVMSLPTLEVEGHIIEPSQSTQAIDAQEDPKRSAFHERYNKAARTGRIHDVLQFNNGAGAGAVISWNIMEYLPFRRMDMLSDGSWSPIRWPLPMGETRDIPTDAWIHNSVFSRMRADPEYRPGNLIVGGGGRGIRRAPESVGMGKWKVLREEGHLIGEVFVRDAAAGDVDALVN